MRKLNISLGVSLALSILVPFLIASFFDVGLQYTIISMMAGLVTWVLFEFGIVRHLFLKDESVPRTVIVLRLFASLVLGSAIISLSAAYFAEPGASISAQKIINMQALSWSIVSVGIMEFGFAIFAARHKQRNYPESRLGANSWLNEGQH